MALLSNMLNSLPLFRREVNAILKKDTSFLTKNESSQKYARLGNVKVKSAITIVAALLLVLYMASVGVSASQNLPNVKTSTSTVTSTSFVCCESTTTTETLSTATVTVTATVTETPDVTSADDQLEITGPDSFSVNIFTASQFIADCVLTVTLSTSGMVSGDSISLISDDSQGRQNFDGTVASNSNIAAYTATLTTHTLSIGFTVGAAHNVIVNWAYTAACPPVL
jgi:hypothetical protein